MPDAVQVLALFLCEVVTAEVGEHAVEYAPVQLVEDDPFTLVHYLLHRRLVAGAPGQRELAGIDLEIHCRDLAHHRTVPVDHGAKHVEGDDLYSACKLTHPDSPYRA